MTRKTRYLCSGSRLVMLPIPLCWSCKHYRENVTCSAFPKGIPAEILDSEFDHHNPIRGDHGIRFEPKEIVVTTAASANGVAKRMRAKKTA